LANLSPDKSVDLPSSHCGIEPHSFRFQPLGARPDDAQIEHGKTAIQIRRPTDQYHLFGLSPNGLLASPLLQPIRGRLRCGIRHCHQPLRH
jgi:hypothetical protein